jgi:hypothetical protein
VELLLQRQESADGCTLGTLLVDGRFQCFTLEDQTRPSGEKIPHQTAIPFGRYQITITQSVRFGRPLPLVNDVPGFTGVRLHSGNTAEDTDGCILLGQSRVSTTKIGNSRVAVELLQPLMQSAIDRGEDIWLTIEPVKDTALRA